MTTPASISPCEVCGGDRFSTLYTVSDTNQDVPGSWSIVRCAGCGLGRLEPMPSAADVSTFYRDAFYSDDGQRFRPWMENLRQGISGLRGWRLRRLMPGGGNLLDFGAGSGHFAQAMRWRGWTATAFEPFNPVHAGEASAQLEHTRLACADGAYDAITLWYVIEHMIDPRGALREFHRALRPGGLLVLSQQDFSSVQARVFKQQWLFLDPPRHLFQFTPETLTRMAEQEGFRLRYRSSASLEMGPFTILQSLLNCIVGNQNYLFRFLKNRRMVSRAAQIDARKGALSAPLVASVLLLPVLAPASLALYFALLAVGSGDVFTLYLERRPDR
jgi:SAM-dependent methyltransferase